MIPWGSYANPGEKGAEETQEQVRKNAIGNIEHEVEDEFQQVEQQAGQQVEKSFARKLLEASLHLIFAFRLGPGEGLSSNYF